LKARLEINSVVLRKHLDVSADMDRPKLEVREGLEVAMKRTLAAIVVVTKSRVAAIRLDERPESEIPSSQVNRGKPLLVHAALASKHSLAAIHATAKLPVVLIKSKEAADSETSSVDVAETAQVAVNAALVAKPRVIAIIVASKFPVACISAGERRD
jgi:hypothetical protein